MTCANCIQTAQYVYSVTPSYKVYYCGRHLPVFLKQRAQSGELNIPVAEPAESAAPVTKSSKKKTAEPVVDEEPWTEEAAGDVIN